MDVYKHAILHVNGPKLWAKIGRIPPNPPNFGRVSGRPARARRLEADEPINKRKKGTRGQKKQPSDRRGNLIRSCAIIVKEQTQSKGVCKEEK